MIHEHRRVIIDYVAIEMNFTCDSAHYSRITEKSPPRWVPKQLIPDLKQRCEAMKLLPCFEAEGDGSLLCIVTGDEC